MRAENYKILMWAFFVLAVVILLYMISVYQGIKNACIPSCPVCMDCGGPRSYGPLIVLGIIDILLWISFIYLWLKRKK